MSARQKMVEILCDKYLFNEVSAHYIARSLLPVLVDEVEAAAEDLRERGVGPEVFVVDDRAAALRASAE